MTAQVPCAHSGGLFAIFSLVASFGQARHVAPCEGARTSVFGLGHFFRGHPYQFYYVVNVGQVLSACLGILFAIFSLVASFGRVRRVMPCEVARLGEYGSSWAVLFEGTRISFSKL